MLCCAVIPAVLHPFAEPRLNKKKKKNAIKNAALSLWVPDTFTRRGLIQPPALRPLCDVGHTATIHAASSRPFVFLIVAQY